MVFGFFGDESLVEQGNTATVLASLIIVNFFKLVIGMAVIRYVD